MMMNTRTGQKASLRPVLFMPCSKSVRDLDRLAKAIVGVHPARSMQPDFRPTILSRFVSPGSHIVSPEAWNPLSFLIALFWGILSHFSLPCFGEVLLRHPK